MKHLEQNNNKIKQNIDKNLILSIRKAAKYVVICSIWNFKSLHKDIVSNSLIAFNLFIWCQMILVAVKF